MRLPKTEVERRRQVVLAYFRKNPTASVAKLNAALKSGELTGKPEKMLNIATGYKWRKEAIATPELPGVEKAVPTTEALVEVLKQGNYNTAPGELKQGCEKAIPCGDGCPGCNFCQAPSDSLPETLSEHAASIERV